MKIYDLQINHLTRPLGFMLNNPCFSYKVACDGAKRQVSARICVFGPDSVPVYDSGESGQIDSLGFTPPLPLRPRTHYTWKVSVTADNGERAESAETWFETGKMEEAWQGQWIAPQPGIVNARLFKCFSLPQRPVSARLYICGLGLYEAYINGEKAGDEYLTPYCNDYDRWMQYQTYDVTDLLSTENELSVMLGDGWYKGRFGFQGQKAVYGDRQALICELHVRLPGGQEQVIISDDSWLGEESQVRFANIYDGEVYDATLVPAPAQPVCLLPQLGTARLTERLSLPVRVTHTVIPSEILHTPAGETVLDLGQEISGYLSFRAAGEYGHIYKLEYGEILQDGCFYQDNLRTAKQEYTYVCDGNEYWTRPHFTFYGFRYVRLTGFGDNPDLKDFLGCVLCSDIAQTAILDTGNALVNRFAQNAVWGQRGNFIDVPTDCPQRDERMGWTGDAQVFCATAMYQTDAAAFYTKFLYDMAAEQRDRAGAVPHVVPSFHMAGSPACAWADAAAVMPWTVYRFTGDLSLLRRTYANMRMWAEWLCHMDDQTGSHRLWQAGAHFADWLALDAAYPESCIGGTDIYFIASAYYYYSLHLARLAAEALGENDDAKRWHTREDEVLAAIRREYRTPSGRLAVRTQTAYVLCLYLGLMPPEDTPALKEALDRAFEESRGELRTGFVGTAYLCRVLSRFGLNNRAYDLFLREKYPGWLYEVKMGATTVWERWNSVLPDGHMSDTGMNSLNHYAYGAIMEWVFGDAAGLSPVKAGFRSARLTPHPDPRLKTLDFAYESAVGRWRSAWQVTGENSFDWQVTVPFGAEAELVLPEAEVAGFAPEWEYTDGAMTCTVGAGEYAMHITFKRAPWQPLLIDLPLSALMENDEMRALIRSCAPSLETVQGAEKLLTMSLRKLRANHNNPLPVWEQKRLETALCTKCFGKV